MIKLTRGEEGYLNRKKGFCHTNQLQLLPLLPIQAFPGLKARELAIEQYNCITWSAPFYSSPHTLLTYSLGLPSSSPLFASSPLVAAYHKLTVYRASFIW
jgi:hypothetical protein